MLRLVQITHPALGRCLALVEQEDRLRRLEHYASAYACAMAALDSGATLASTVESSLSQETFDYDAIYNGRSKWRLLPAFDHPEEPARCLVSGTGLTHRKSADNRHAMHQSGAERAVVTTDSMRIYEWGVEGGRPARGAIGSQPEWFYKGCGTILRAHGDPLDVPNYAEDGGEEAEIAGLYVVDAESRPRRVGFAVGNEFSDHRMEARNYLYLAPSKLRTCALGPELLVGAEFANLHGTATVEREGRTLWSQAITSGEEGMVHSLANLEHHHFKYAPHRRPGDAHIHFFGTGGFSFGSGIRLQDGDLMVISFDEYGRPLQNPVRIDPTRPELLEVYQL